MVKIERIFDLLPYILEKYNNNVSLAGKKKGKWLTYSAGQYSEISNKVSFGLLALGITKGDRIATITNNRPEWNFVDMGMLQLGAVHVPIYPTINEEELTFILNETRAKIIFVSNKFLYSKVTNLLSSVSGLERIFTFDNIDGAKNFNQVIESGERNTDYDNLEKIKKQINPDELASIIYTSGIDSTPRGVMLTHRNHVSNFIAAAPTLKMDSSFKALSYLPINRAFERMTNYMYQYLGITIYYAGSATSIITNLKEVRPNVITTVPIFLEKIYEYLVSEGIKLKSAPKSQIASKMLFLAKPAKNANVLSKCYEQLRKSIFLWALNLGLKYKLNRENGCWYEFQLKIADKIVFNKWRKAFGGNIKRIISGGASLQNYLLKIFWAAKIPVYEGYGLTETSPLLSNNTYDNIKFNTVGKILQGVELKIASDGEILCKGQNVMKGYFKNSELTAEIIDSMGWLHTGDFGVIDDEGFLKITGHKKDVFKISSGIYVNPELIENKLKLSPFIKQAIVIGANQSFLSAIIIPDYSKLKNKNNMVTEKIQEEINNYNKKYGELGQIKKFDLISDEWTVETGEITKDGKLNRSFIYKKYHYIIEKLYDIKLKKLSLL